MIYKTKDISTAGSALTSTIAWCRGLGFVQYPRKGLLNDS